MNPGQIVLAVVITAVVLAICGAVALAFFHKKIDQTLTEVGKKVDGVEDTLAGQNEKIAVIHHAVTNPPPHPVVIQVPAATAPAADASVKK